MDPSSSLQVADGEDSLQIWRAALNILTSDKGWSSSLWDPKEVACYEMLDRVKEDVA